MSIGLDLGSTELRALRSDEQRLIARRCPTGYIALPAVESQQRLLEQAGISYMTSGGKLLVVNQNSGELARLFHVPSDSVLPDGRLPQSDPVARQLISAFLDALLPGSSSIESCVMTVPGGHSNIHENPETDYFSLLLRLKGYFPIPIHSAHALALAELGDRQFTGVGMVIGASSSEMSVVHQGREIAYGSIAKGTHWLDEEIGTASDHYAWDRKGQRFLDLESVRAWKSDPNLSLTSPMNEAEQILTERYRAMIRSIIEGVMPQIAAEGKRIRKMIPDDSIMIVGGGPTLIGGFASIFEKMFDEVSWPMHVSGIRYDKKPTWTISRGCLIHAELETEYDLKFAA